MASNLFGLARKVSEYVRMRHGRQYRRADEAIEDSPRQSTYMRSRQGLYRRFKSILFGEDHPASPPVPPHPDQRQGAPPLPPAPHQPGYGGSGQPEPPPFAPPGSRYPKLPGPPPPGSAPGTSPGSGSGGQGGGKPPGPPAPPPPPPPDPPGPPDPDRPGKPGDDFGPELGSGDIELLGRDAGYDVADFEAVMVAMRLTPGSSNVYGYFFEREARRTGILYVTFLAEGRGGKRSGPGPTYAYYDVPVRKAHEFQKASKESAGGAVWDYLRIRGTIAGHQHQYRLVHVSGEYVPRKVTPLGYKNRAVPALGTGKRTFRRNTLPERAFFSRGGPNRGGPDRGEPNRGR